MEWQELGLCRQVDPEIFYPDKSDVLSSRAAKKVCSACEVIDECFKAGLHEEYGIWGGTTSFERRRIRAQMRLAG